MAHEDWTKPPAPTPTQEELKLAWEITNLTSALSEKLVANMQLALAARTQELAACKAELVRLRNELGSAQDQGPRA